MDSRFRVPSAFLVGFACLLACRERPADDVAPQEALSRTEFTDRIENFFEYEPLSTGRASRFLIHLTDLSEGSPVAGADVTLNVHKNGEAVAETAARPGRVAGIYIADVSLDEPGECAITFRIQSNALDERMELEGFRVD